MTTQAIRILYAVAALLVQFGTVSFVSGANNVNHENLRIGGVGGLYILAEPGELTVEIAKWDLGGRTPANLKAILIGPDRQVLDTIGIAEGAPDGAYHALKTRVDQTGIYAVNVTITYDRYGEQVRWGFRTNAARYLIETSRGHKDARHLEPIVVDYTEGPADVCFAARSARMEIEVEEYPGNGSPPVLHDDAGNTTELSQDTEGKFTISLPEADRSTGKPWRLNLPDGKGVVHIDGVTRWDRSEPYENLSLWSPSVESHFPFQDLRWMLAPFRHAFHAKAGEPYAVEFTVHNNGAASDTITLASDSDQVGIALSATSIDLAPDESATVTATITTPKEAVPGETRVGRITAKSSTHSGISTWSTIEGRVGQASQLDLTGPLVYKPYEHENEQFAYTPDYPTVNQIYFSPENEPYIRVDDGVVRASDGGWTTIDTVDGERYRAITSKVAFGEDGAVCLLGRSNGLTAYLYSSDGGNTFVASPIPEREARRQQWDIEQFAGHNTPKGPAPILRATETGEYDPANFWRHVNDLELFVPKVVNGKVEVGDPILIATQGIGISSHSGIPSAIVSQGDRIHICWGEATDPDGDEPGVPAYVATYDRKEERLLGEKAFVGFGPPANDVHNTPSIVIDSEGYLHTLTGTHGQPFAYAKSLEPHTAHAGFTEPELVEENLRSTYIGFVCDPDDTLHLVFRTWKDDGEYHPVGYYANLAYKRKRKGGDWEPMKRLAVAPFTEYSIWYHRLTIDRKGRLFVSFDYWSTFWFYRVDHYGNTPGRGQAGGGGRRKTIMSSDGGESWKLLLTKDL